MATILLVDDNEYNRGATKAFLLHAGHEVVEAGDGKAAQAILERGSFDLVISDIQMPVMNGVQLLAWVKANTTIPVILFTGFSTIMDTYRAGELGADDFLTKPFDAGALERAIGNLIAGNNKASSPKSAADVAPALDEFCKISLADFVSGKCVNCDLFIRLGESKYIKIAHKGEVVPLEQIDKFRKRNVPHLYLRKEDLAAYIGMNVALTGAVKNASQIPREKKMRFMKHAVETVLERFHCEEVDEDSLDHAKTVLENSISILSEDGAAFSLIEMLNTHSDFLYAHSLGVSVYSTMIARQLRWRSPQNIYKLAISGLLHDIGKKELDRALVEKPRKDLTFEEMRLYESHSTRGLDILGSVASIPSDVLQVTVQHHENCLGQGFPRGLKKQAIHPLARVVMVADAFCSFSIKSPKGGGMKPKEALERLITSHSATFDGAMIGGLMKVFTFEAASAIRR